MRKRAGVIITCRQAKKVLLIERRKGEECYWVIPGGGVESGESEKEAAIREISEELNIILTEVHNAFKVKSEVTYEVYFSYDMDNFYECEIHGEEKRKQNKDNQYIPKWIDIDDIEKINLLSNECKMKLLEFLFGGKNRFR